MDFRFSPEVEAFQREVRAFFAGEMAADRRAGEEDVRDLTGLGEAFERRLHAKAGERGYLGLSLPADVGGSGLDVSHQAAFNFEAAFADAPVIDTAMTLAGHPILAHGSEAQRRFFLPRMLRGEIEMCIAYTEPDAGSDLSAITTTAYPPADGEGFVLNGRKALVTGGHKADWCCTVARTSADAPARNALTMLMVSMDAEGVSSRRRTTMNGWTLSEIEFDSVALGPDAVLGERDGGWRQLVSAVQAERSGMFYFGLARHVLDLLEDHVRATSPDDPLVRDRVAALEIDVAAGLRLAKRTLWLQQQDRPNTVLASMTKVYATELLQRLAQAATEIGGHRGSVYGPLFGDPPHGAGAGRFAWEYLERVHGTISVGANELQRDGIAQFGLSLPRARR